MEKVILGIDPGSLKTGFGLVKLMPDKSVVHISHGVIVLDGKKDISRRLQDLSLDLLSLIKKYQPHVAAVEDIFFAKNVKSALVLGQARGALMAILGLNKIPVCSYSPTKVKSTITGTGRAQKFQVAQMVALQLGISTPTQEDSSDALSLALAHVFHEKILVRSYEES